MMSIVSERLGQTKPHYIPSQANNTQYCKDEQTLKSNTTTTCSHSILI